MNQIFPVYRHQRIRPFPFPSVSPIQNMAGLLQRYCQIREQTIQLCAGLTEEDCMVQSMPDTSPVKWHLAHATWFFETFILARLSPDRTPFHPQFQTLFNSYYVGVGARQPRPERGVLSRPSFKEVMLYRKTTDNDMMELLSTQTLPNELFDLVELGLHHEQQHQELILTDLKHHFWRNPLHPIYRQHAAFPADENSGSSSSLSFLLFDGGLQSIGHDGEDFCFDNETPSHQVCLEPYELATRLVTNAEYLAFIADGGYRRPELWLSDGWEMRSKENWEAPLYWLRAADDKAFDRMFTLSGDQLIAMQEPVSHVSYYEADAYARWAGARLPTEFEWENAARASSNAVAFIRPGNFLGSANFHPRYAAVSTGLRQMFGDVWEWTNSAYLPYPGFHAADGAVGEYNGKFMINQMVLRGGSCATPHNHIRASYRNFFPPHARWQFSGIRLARDIPRRSSQASYTSHSGMQQVTYA
jgi:ergothioneine biosynthesis protein EgtB